MSWPSEIFSIVLIKMKTTSMMSLSHTSKFITKWSGTSLYPLLDTSILEMTLKKVLSLLVSLNLRLNQLNKSWICSSWVIEDVPLKRPMPTKLLPEAMPFSKSTSTKFQKLKTPKFKLFSENYPSLIWQDLKEALSLKIEVSGLWKAPKSTDHSWPLPIASMLWEIKIKKASSYLTE